MTPRLTPAWLRRISTPAAQLAATDAGRIEPSLARSPDPDWSLLSKLVELLATPVVRVENLFVRPDWATGRILVEANLRNAGSKTRQVNVRFVVSAGGSGQSLDGAFIEQDAPAGDTLLRGELCVPCWRLWTLEDPFLYRVSAQVGAARSTSFDEQSARCGFRDFRYENNAFRFNGKRLYLQGSLLLPTYPIGYSVMPREDFLRRDLTSLKLMGLNAVRGLWGGLRARDLDLFDELGILMLQEHNGSIQIQESPQLEARFLHSMTAMIRRDRNHPSVVGWCLLNEMWSGRQFDCAAASLPLIRHLDDSRFVFLNSGGFDMKFNQGSICNPGAFDWQCLMGSEETNGPVLTFGGEYGLMLDNRAPLKADIHPYQAVPHTSTEPTPKSKIMKTHSTILLTLLLPLASSLGAGPGPSPVPTVVQSLDGPGWLLATDSKNLGRDEKWFAAPRAGAAQTRVPWIIQDAFPAYHGVAWYWREFVAPANPHPQGRFLLRFWAVDYKAEVWLNGQPVGGHEGGETPFTLDVTGSLKPGQANALAVRVVNPAHERIDGLVMGEIPRQARVVPYGAGAAYNHGGIVGSVELLAAPALRVEDLFAQADPKTGMIKIQARLHNAATAAVRGRIELAVGPAASGETLRAQVLERELPPGGTLVTAELKIDQPRLWELNDPFLYRVTAQVRGGDSGSMDERSVRCGFRDFRFENGWFRLNGRRLFVRSTHTCNHFPVGLKLPPDPDMARRDLLDLKVMGFNMIRFIWGGAERYQLDLCDEIGLMVYEESFASAQINDSPKLRERWERSISELIQRDRNHPSVVIWGLLNEIPVNPHFRLAADSLPLVRQFDDSRMVLINSGRWDLSGAGGGAEVFAKLDTWRSQPVYEPWVAFNPSAQPIETPFQFTWPARQVALHPGPNGEYSVLRWTAPAAGRYTVTATFSGLFNATVDAHLLHNGRSRFDALLNLQGRPNAATNVTELDLARNDTLDFVVGCGNGSYGSDSTALSLAIKSPTGRVFDPAADFPRDKNPGEVWSCGRLAPGAKPDSATFTPYTETGRTRHARLGSFANPGSAQWQDELGDRHIYPRVPHTADIIQSLRTATGDPQPLFLSEYGIGSAVDLWRVTRHFERLGKTGVEDARFYRDKLDRYLADWKRWKLDELYARPEDFFAESLQKMAGQRTLGLNAIRSNPNMVGYSLTGMNDHVSCGEGLTTTFRDLKPGTVDAMFEGWAPLRWCLFAEPVNVYRGARLRLEAVLANEDALPPGQYPARLQVVGPGVTRVWEKTVTVTIPAAAPAGGKEPPMVVPVLAEDLTVNGPAGQYRFLATLEKGGAPTGGATEFYVDDPAMLPTVDTEVVLWGEDAALSKWLTAHRVRSRPFAAGEAATREVILASRTPAAPGDAAAFAQLARRIARGSTVVFLSPEIFKQGNKPLGWLPLSNKGAAPAVWGWLYLKDEWAKRHPIFEGLPSGGLMDYTFYREIIPDVVLAGQDPPAEAVAGAIKASQDYSSGLMLAVYDLGAGRFVLNTLRIREQLGLHPAADRLLLNLLRYAARDQTKPPADLPPDFEARLRSLGY